jgi:hypothetical protein
LSTILDVSKPSSLKYVINTSEKQTIHKQLFTQIHYSILPLNITVCFEIRIIIMILSSSIMLPRIVLLQSNTSTDLILFL